MNDLIGLEVLSFFGPAIERPECVVATAKGDLFVGDGRGGIMHVAPDGDARLILARNPPAEGFVPNGIALLANHDVLCANMGLAGGVWRLSPNGDLSPFLQEVEGMTLPQTNFVGIDRAGRTWVSVSTRLTPVAACAHEGWADGFVILVDDHGARIVADDIGLTNEAKVDPSGKWLYVVETIARRLSRLPIRADGSLGLRETVSEFTRPGALPDGLAFDADGGVWVTTIVRNAIVQLKADGTQLWHLEDVDEAHVEEVEARFQSGGFPGWEPGADRVLNTPTSIAFSGPDLRTAVIGFLRGNRLARFRSPVAGAPPPHWHF